VWFSLSVAAQLLCCTRDHSCSRPQTPTNMLVSMLDFWGLTGRGLAQVVKRLSILCTFSQTQTFKHLLKEQKISYPMHVSGHGMVEWVQRYACAKSSETVWLAGGQVVHGGTQRLPDTTQKFPIMGSTVQNISHRKNNVFEGCG